jgi:hypothetical protein
MSFTTARTSTQNTAGLLGTLRLFGNRPNLLLKMIGGYVPPGDGIEGEGHIVGAGWAATVQRRFPLTADYDLPTPAQPTILEGAAAPNAITYTPEQDENVVQLFHEKVSLTYLGQSEVGRMTATGVLSIGSSDPFEYSGVDQRQIGLALRKIARDANHSFWNGVYANPANPLTDALGTRGILPAITTSVIAAGGAALSKTLIERLYERMNVNAGVQPETGLVIACGPMQLRALNAAYETDFRQGLDRMVGGLMTRTVFTPFGVLAVPVEGAWDLDIPNDTLALVNPDAIRGRYLPIKSETLLIEPLAKTGSADDYQIYGQMGIDYGAEWLHGKLTGLALPDGSGSGS